MSKANTITVIVENEGWDAVVPDAADRCRLAALAALAVPGAPPDVQDRPTALLLTDDATLRDLNSRFRGQDAATNVLSFPHENIDQWPDGLASPLGDVAIAFETTRREAQADGKTVADHLSHLVVHGMLHLLGYDHQRVDEAERMESLEIKVLAELGIESPYGQNVAG